MYKFIASSFAGIAALTSIASANASIISVTGFADGSDVISDTSPVSSTISVLSPYRVADVNVTVNLEHTWVGDLILELTGPNMSTIRLMGDGPSGTAGSDGFNGDNLEMTIFDDEASELIAGVIATDAPFTGSFIPREALSVFDGGAISGDWTLSIFDDAMGDNGTFLDWTIDIEIPEPATIALFGAGLIAAAGARRRKCA